MDLISVTAIWMEHVWRQWFQFVAFEASPWARRSTAKFSRFKVCSLPKSWTISPTGGPSSSPLKTVRRHFISIGNLILFVFENCRKKLVTLLDSTPSPPPPSWPKSRARSRKTSDEIGPWYEKRVGAIHKNENSGNVKSLRRTKRPLAHWSCFSRRLSGTISPDDLKWSIKTEKKLASNQHVAFSLCLTTASSLASSLLLVNFSLNAQTQRRCQSIYVASCYKPNV